MQCASQGGGLGRFPHVAPDERGTSNECVHSCEHVVAKIGEGFNYHDVKAPAEQLAEKRRVYSAILLRSVLHVSPRYGRQLDGAESGRRGIVLRRAVRCPAAIEDAKVNSRSLGKGSKERHAPRRAKALTDGDAAVLIQSDTPMLVLEPEPF
jgi:hypothetical protein